MKTANIPICVHECFKDLIVVNDACKPYNCSGDVKTLLQVSSLDIKEMELLADGNGKKKNYIDVANEAINQSWDRVIEYVEEGLGDKFSIKNELFNDSLCDKPKVEDCVTINPDGLTGVRIRFFQNTKAECNTLTHIGVWKLNQGNGDYSVTIKETYTGEEKQYILPLKFGWNNIEIPNGGYKMKTNEIDVCFDTDSGLIIGSYEPCLQKEDGCNSCGNTPKIKHPDKHRFFTIQGLTWGEFDSSTCPQIGGVVPHMKFECKIEDFLCCYKHDLCKLVIKQIDIYLLTQSLKPNCGFNAYNKLGEEWVRDKLENLAKQINSRLKTICRKILSNDANIHDACLNCEAKWSQGTQVR